jgi:hypothetical protein
MTRIYDATAEEVAESSPEDQAKLFSEYRIARGRIRAAFSSGRGC